VLKNELIYHVSWRIKNSREDMKLSLDEEKNEVSLWISGFKEVETKTDFSDQNSNKFIGLSHVIKKYKFPPTMNILSTFFLESKYLVFQMIGTGTEEKTPKKSSQNNRKDQAQIEEYKNNDLMAQREDSTQSFLIMNLLQEIRYGNNGDNTAFKFNFLRKLTNNGEEMCPKIISSNEQEITIQLYLSDKQWENKIEVKTLDSGELLFFVKNSISTFFLLFDFKEKKVLCNTILSFDNPLIDLIPIKGKLNTKQLSLFAIDSDYEVWNVIYSENELKVGQVKYEIPQQVEPEIKEFSSKRLPNTKRKYFHGDILILNGQTTNCFVFFKKSMFHFVDTDTCKVDHLLIKWETKVAEIYDWNINSNCLYVNTNNGLYIFRITFLDSSQPSLMTPVQTQWEKYHYYGQWIYVNDSYTLLLSSYLDKANSDKIDLIIGSTQDILLGNHRGISSPDFYEIFLWILW